MIEKVFLRVANYIWPGAKYTYSDANGASGGIATMWNPDRTMGMDISISTHFVAKKFTTQAGSSIVFNLYAPNTQNGKFFF